VGIYRRRRLILYMSIELEIYLNTIIKFFTKNPKDLSNLVPLEKKDEFFSKLRETAKQNVEKGEEPTLTKKQFIEICVEINGKTLKEHIIKNPIIYTEWGEYSLN